MLLLQSQSFTFIPWDDLRAKSVDEKDREFVLKQPLVAYLKRLILTYHDSIPAKSYRKLLFIVDVIYGSLCITSTYYYYFLLLLNYFFYLQNQKSFILPAFTIVASNQMEWIEFFSCFDILFLKKYTLL